MKWRIVCLILIISTLLFILLAQQEHTSAQEEFLPPEPQKIVIPEALKRVAFCESGDRQFDDAGQVIRGKIHPPDTGRFQINLAVHSEKLKELGLDPETEEGNTKYALYLYEKEGLKPWEASKHCWGGTS